MSSQNLTEAILPHRPIDTEYDVQLQPIRNPILRVILYALPWAILVYILIYMAQFDGDVLFVTALFTAALALFAFQMLMQQIPGAFDVLWGRKIIASRSSNSVDTHKPPPQADPPTVETKPAELSEVYADYLEGVEYSLNHVGSLILGLVFAGFGVARWPYQAGSLSAFLRQFPQISTIVKLEILFEGFLGFMLGLMVWRMLFTALQVSQLDKHFDLEIKFDHPDEAGGLEPLGNLCLWNALILAIPGIFLGAWILIGPRFPMYLQREANQIVFRYSDLYYKLILVPIILAPLSFVLPLWSLHRVMEEKAVQIRRDLDHLGERIDRLARELLSRADEQSPQETETKIKNLELMQKVYLTNRKIPVWPLNTSVVIKFATSQVVPLLGLTGLGQPILKVVDAIAKFIGQP
jgi:hypothetical protein